MLWEVRCLEQNGASSFLLQSRFTSFVLGLFVTLLPCIKTHQGLRLGKWHVLNHWFCRSQRPSPAFRTRNMVTQSAKSESQILQTMHLCSQSTVILEVEFLCLIFFVCSASTQLVLWNEFNVSWWAVMPPFRGPHMIHTPSMPTSTRWILYGLVMCRQAAFLHVGGMDCWKVLLQHFSHICKSCRKQAAFHHISPAVHPVDSSPSVLAFFPK